MCTKIPFKYCLDPSNAALRVEHRRPNLGKAILGGCQKQVGKENPQADIPTQRWELPSDLPHLQTGETAGEKHFWKA